MIGGRITGRCGKDRKRGLRVQGGREGGQEVISRKRKREKGRNRDGKRCGFIIELAFSC